MALTAQQIIGLAVETAKVEGFLVQAGEILNEIQSDLCDQYDFADARRLFNFNFNTALVSHFGSGPYPLPVDYLRSSGSSGSEGTQKSSWWTLNGVPYPMIPVDLSEFDMQVQQAGQQSYPWLWATDMSVRRLVLMTAGNTHGTTILDNLASTAGIAVGIGVGGDDFTPGTTVTAVSGSTVTLSQPALSSARVPVIFGFGGQAYAYPPPSGGYPVSIRYQCRKPNIISPETSGVIPWFPNQGYLRRELEGRLMALSDDTRMFAFLSSVDGSGGSGDMLRRYMKLKDDDTNRAKTVQLDDRIFGSPFRKLKNTKQVGW